MYSFIVLAFIGFLCSLSFLGYYKSYMLRLEKVKLFLLANFYSETVINILSILVILVLPKQRFHEEQRYDDVHSIKDH